MSEQQRYITDMKEMSDEVKEPPVKRVSPPLSLPVVQETQKKFTFSAKEIILIVVNVVSVILLIVLLIQLPLKADMLRTLRITDFQDEAALSFEFSRVNLRKNEGDMLEQIFLNDSGIIQFVNDVEKLKTTGGAIQRVVFSAQTAVKDRTGNFGLPVTIEMNGSWDSIGRDLEKIQALPYVFRPIMFDAKPNIEQAGTTNVKYGILLYVKDSVKGDSR